MKVLAIIPAYNEASHIASVLEKTRPLVDGIIVIDDGSTDGSNHVACQAGALVVRHAINSGLGAALGTGFAAARALGADIVITLDADGQHDPHEIPAFVEAIRQGADLVIGSRMLFTSSPSQGGEGGMSTMPWYRIIANMLGNLATFFLFGAWVSDSQSGFRALSRRALETIDVQANRMEVSSEIIAEARRHGLKIGEIPIQAIYTDYSLSKGQGFFVGLKTLVRLVVRRLTQ